MEFKINIHSVIDIITNSSTEIYTYSDGTIEPLKKLVNEMFKIHGIDKTFDDVFIATVNSDIYVYTEYEDKPDELSNDEINSLFTDIQQGKAEKPQWMKDAESQENSWTYYSPETYLSIITKDKKYDEFAMLVKSFLYSTDQEACYNG